MNKHELQEDARHVAQSLGLAGKLLVAVAVGLLYGLLLGLAMYLRVLWECLKPGKP